MQKGAWWWWCCTGCAAARACTRACVRGGGGGFTPGCCSCPAHSCRRAGQRARALMRRCPLPLAPRSRTPADGNPSERRRATSTAVGVVSRRASSCCTSARPMWAGGGPGADRADAAARRRRGASERVAMPAPPQSPMQGQLTCWVQRHLVLFVRRVQVSATRHQLAHLRADARLGAGGRNAAARHASTQNTRTRTTLHACARWARSMAFSAWSACICAHAGEGQPWCVEERQQGEAPCPARPPHPTLQPCPLACCLDALSSASSPADVVNSWALELLSEVHFTCARGGGGGGGLVGMRRRDGALHAARWLRPAASASCHLQLIQQLLALQAHAARRLAVGDAAGWWRGRAESLLDT